MVREVWSILCTIASEGPMLSVVTVTERTKTAELLVLDDLLVRAHGRKMSKSGTVTCKIGQKSPTGDRIENIG